MICIKTRCLAFVYNTTNEASEVLSLKIIAEEGPSEDEHECDAKPGDVFFSTLRGASRPPINYR